jgi:cytochrome c556
MRKIKVRLTVLAFLFCCVGAVKAQSKPEVITNIERAVKEMEPEWHCVSEYTPSGEPGSETPRGTKYLFSCQRSTMVLTMFIFRGESKQDAEKMLAWSQRLQVNESKPLDGLGEQAYQLAKERFAWITFRKANVFTQINVSVLNSTKTHSASEMEPLTADALFEAAESFAHLVAGCVPAT